MNVFTKTVEDLKNLNTELYEKKRETETKISELNSINEEINATMESNKNIITKIENFFNN
jgi:predicted RNase H-like nuclease (RuvC/YqgF family)